MDVSKWIKKIHTYVCNISLIIKPNLNKFITATSNKSSIIYVHSINTTRFTTIKFPNLSSVICFPVPYFPICSASYNLTFIRTIAYSFEQSICKEYLAAYIVSGVNYEYIMNIIIMMYLCACLLIDWK